MNDEYGVEGHISALKTILKLTKLDQIAVERKIEFLKFKIYSLKMQRKCFPLYRNELGKV